MGLYKNDEDITKKCLSVSVGFSKLNSFKEEFSVASLESQILWKLIISDLTIFLKVPFRWKQFLWLSLGFHIHICIYIHIKCQH